MTGAHFLDHPVNRADVVVPRSVLSVAKATDSEPRQRNARPNENEWNIVYQFQLRHRVTTWVPGGRRKVWRNGTA